MNMNKISLTQVLALSLMTVGFAGCTDDNISGGEPLPEGTEFNFGAIVESNKTRTYYDPTDEANPNATEWKIFWNYQAPLDHIYIYSPQAATGLNQASYTVNATQDMSEPAPVTKDGDAGVQLSAADSYDFYAMYPSSAVTTGSGTGTKLSATMPVNQTASTTETMTTDPVGELQTTADMNCALMIAKKTGYVPDTENKAQVQLDFEPFATMMDITVNGTDNNTTNSVRVTSVIIEADAPIAGNFTYDYASGAFTFGDNASNQIAIETMFNDADGDKVGVMMGNESTLRVRAFMIPNPAVSSLKVKVVTSDARTMTKNLTMNNFQPKQIHFAKLPKIDVENLDFDYTIWLSQLAPNIYISELSMPGSALSFNYRMSDEISKTQTLGLTEQFNAGVRVFQCHINTITQTSSIDNGTTSVAIATSTGGNILKDDGSTYWTLGDVINALHKEMTGIHSEEFCVLTISDWIGGVDEDKLATLYTRLNAVLDKAGDMGLVATGVNANTTIGDVKGKVIIKVQLNGGYTGAWGNLDQANVWANIYSGDAESNVFYSPMPYGTLPATDAGGTSSSALTGDMNIIYSDCANPVEWNYVFLSGYKLSYKTGVQANATAVLTAYADNYNSDEHKNFSMTYLGGCGATARSGSYNKYLPSEVAQTLNNLWLDYTSKPADKPWGWVMFNCVGTEDTTTQGITAVIEHNASPDFKLARRSDKPSGDTNGTANGGSIF